MSEAEKLKADAVLESAAQQLQDILIGLAAKAEPQFPYFSSSSLKLIEVELGAYANPNLGFIALRPDGQLYELKMGFDIDPWGLGPQHGLTELSLPPKEYILYAYTAICQLTDLLGKAGDRG